MMRAFAFVALTGGFIAAAAPIEASANTMTESFTIDISGSTNQLFPSTPFAGFDPSLGTLTSATQSLTGSTTWTPSESTLGPGISATLLMGLVSPIPSVQVFASIFPEMIFVDLTGATTTIGSGLQVTTLSADDTSDGGTLTPATLDGTVTYTFTPVVPTIPEPSTWAMMLIGFAGLGYAASRRRSAASAISA
jgi:PEP-CTERM motif